MTTTATATATATSILCDGSNKIRAFKGLFTRTESDSSSPEEENTESPLLAHVDQMLLLTESDGEAKEMLRTMVADLLREADSLKSRMDEAEEKLARLSEEKASIDKKDGERLQSILLALKGVTGEAAKTQTEMGTINSDQATELVISTLTKKIEDLNIENTLLGEQNSDLYEQIQDLESENEASLHKIDALEIQFKSINKTRQKVVSRIIASPSKAPNSATNKLRDK